MAEPSSTNDSNTYPEPALFLFLLTRYLRQRYCWTREQVQLPVMVALARVFTSSHSEQSS